MRELPVQGKSKVERAIWNSVLAGGSARPRSYPYGGNGCTQSRGYPEGGTKGWIYYHLDVNHIHLNNYQALS